MFKIKILNDDIFYYNDESNSLLDSAIEQGFSIDHSCKNGRCGSCECILVKGETELIHNEELIVSNSENMILACCVKPKSDLIIELKKPSLKLPKPTLFPCKIDSLEKLSKNVVKVVLRYPPGRNFNFIPGQYLDVIYNDTIKRSYSIVFNKNLTNKIELHIRKYPNGEMSKYWFENAEINDLLKFKGPYGNFILNETQNKSLIFMATGTGFAPIKSLLEQIKSFDKSKQPSEIYLFWGNRNIEDFYFDIAELDLNIKYFPVLSKKSKNWKGETGYIQNILFNLNLDINKYLIYACGSENMIKDTRLLFKNYKNKFYTDTFTKTN